MRLFGLIGKNIDYSFSRTYFNTFFEDKNLRYCTYKNFSLESINYFPNLLKEHPDLGGLNVTVPYKEEIIPFLDMLSPKAAEIGAVNVIRFEKNGHLKGYNSDYYGFKNSLLPLLKPHQKNALILGNGGASKAVRYALSSLGINHQTVSRKSGQNTLTYHDLDKTVMEQFQIVINCTPVGTFPDLDQCPIIPYEYLTKNHLVYDLIYNPEETLFLKKARLQDALTKNGHEMLLLQAQKAWQIWNK